MECQNNFAWHRRKTRPPDTNAQPQSCFLRSPRFVSSKRGFELSVGFSIHIAIAFR